MMRSGRLKNRGRDTGAVMVEFAIAGPLLLVMMLGAADFARVFYNAVTAANAAGTAAFYGAQNTITSGQYSVMQQVAINDATDLAGVSATASRYCDCPGGAKVDCVTGSCSGYGSPRVYVQTQVQQTFHTIVQHPRVPDAVLVGRKAFMRVQ